MPHVVIEGVADLTEFERAWQPFVLRSGADILRADHLYLSPDARAALIEALCVEAGRKQPFYVKLAVHDRGSATVRVDPMTHPERSHGRARSGRARRRAAPARDAGRTDRSHQPRGTIPGRRR